MQLPTTANNCQQRPTTANKGQQGPTRANQAQQLPTTANSCQQPPTTANNCQQVSKIVDQVSTGCRHESTGVTKSLRLTHTATAATNATDTCCTPSSMALPCGRACLGNGVASDGHHDLGFFLAQPSFAALFHLHFARTPTALAATSYHYYQLCHCCCCCYHRRWWWCCYHSPQPGPLLQRRHWGGGVVGAVRSTDSMPAGGPKERAVRGPVVAHKLGRQNDPMGNAWNPLQPIPGPARPNDTRRPRVGRFLSLGTRIPPPPPSQPSGPT